MAIIIPSKNIYGKNNPKIINNVVDNVNVETTVITPINEYNIPVYVLEHNTTSLKDSYGAWITDDKSRIDTPAISAYDYYSRVNVGLRTVYSNNIKAEIDKEIKNSYISKLLLGTNPSGYPNINYTVIYNLYKGTAKFETPLEGNNKLTLTYNNPPETLKGYLPALYVTHSATNTNGTVVSATVEANDTTNLSAVAVDNIEARYWSVTIPRILCGMEIYKVAETGSVLKTQWNGMTRDWVMEGTCEKYEPVGLEINFNGNTVGIELSNGSIPYGKGNKPFSLNGNELLQDSSTVNGKLLTQHLAENILEQYANGKETATILCQIGNYYDYDTKEKVISIDNDNLPMLFEFGDKVIPMIFTANQEDVPMSKNRNGEPKVFVVVKKNIFYDGAVWQEITLQEI